MSDEIERKPKKKNVKKIGKKMKKSQAKKWVKRYQKENPCAELNGYLFGNDILEKLCKNPDAEGIWIFKAINNKDEECFVLFPADKDGNILNKKKIRSLGAAANTKNGDDDDDDPANDGQGCPPYCPEGI